MKSKITSAKPDTKTILLIDDEKVIHGFLEVIFAPLNYKLIGVTTCKAAAKKLKTEKIDLILLDMYMPGVNGIECLNNFKNMGIDLPIIMLTAAAEIQACADCFEKGVKAYIVKPFENEDLIKKVQKFLV